MEIEMNAPEGWVAIDGERFDAAPEVVRLLLRTRCELWELRCRGEDAIFTNAAPPADTREDG